MATKDSTPAPQSLVSRILKTELVDWRKFQFIQQDDFKAWSEEEQDKLIKSILENQFAAPFYVWCDPSDGEIYCLDGKHRTLALEKMILQGIDVPSLLPATFIHCVDKQEAAKLVLIYSSLYAKITNQGLFDFISLYDLNFDEIKMEINLPEFSFPRFEQKFEFFPGDEVQEPPVEIDAKEVIVTTGDIFEINGHRVACGPFQDPKLLKKLMNGKLARILNTDPPYNLSADFIVKENSKDKGKVRHEDFAQAAGEMSDAEFVAFLVEVMKTAMTLTYQGAIHYIFMDWRHIWHITEAARWSYGSQIPKQLCVWNKDTMALGSFYRSKHELVFIFKNGDDQKHVSNVDLKDRIRSNVWDYPSANSTANKEKEILKDHPTPKPVQLVADSILDTTKEQDIVLDFFLGSGTCMIAAEQTGRFCYATEIEAKHLQQSIIRYINYCEKKGIKVKLKHVNGSLTLKSFTHGSSE